MSEIAPIAGIEVGCPKTIEEIDAAWLTKVFRASGALDEAGSVASVEIEPFAVGLGFLSVLNRATMTYDGDAGDAPATVIVKMITEIPEQRGIAEAMFFYQREVRFYQELAPNAGFRSLRAYAAMMAEEGHEFVLIMEEAPYRVLGRGDGVSASDAALSVDTMAGFHGKFMGKDLSDLETTFVPVKNPTNEAVLPQVFAAGWEPCKAACPELLNPEIIAFGDTFVERLPFMFDTFKPTTLVHGDWRADNLMFDEATGELVVIDFQIMGTGPATYDLGYFLSQSLEPELYNAEQEKLVDRYFEKLTATGASFDRDELMFAYKVTTAFALIYPVSIFPAWDQMDETMRTTSRSMLTRTVNALLATNALEVFPS